MSIRELKIKPDPDFNRLEKALRRDGTPDRVPFFELFSDVEGEALRAIGFPMPEPPAEPGSPARRESILRRHVEYMFRLGYDYASVGVRGADFPKGPIPTAMTTQGERTYYQAGTHTIATREDFEKYPWPRPGDLDFSALELARSILPEGMKVVAGHTGILENVMWLLGYEAIGLLLYDDESFVADMFEAVAKPIVAYYDAVASCDIVGAVKMGEDMGFRTQTMLSPKTLRKHLFPWHKKLVEAVHRHGKPAILHSCGNLRMIMDDIFDCGWDAKHSFEDAIMPVWEAKEAYGDRLAMLGGFDIDKISRMTPDEVRRHTRMLIEKCAPGGGWALGTGNSVANYIPLENFLAMIEEGFAAGRY